MIFLHPTLDYQPFQDQHVLKKLINKLMLAHQEVMFLGMFVVCLFVSVHDKSKGRELENLRIKLNFYKIISYLVDRCNSPAPSRSRQTLEKNVLSWALAWTGSVVFTRQVSPDTQLPYCACARMRTSSFCCLPSKVPLI